LGIIDYVLLLFRTKKNINLFGNFFVVGNKNHFFFVPEIRFGIESKSKKKLLLVIRNNS